MLRALWSLLFAFAILWAAPPCAAADLETACAKFNSCYNGGGHDVCWKRQESLLLKKRDAKASRDGASLHVMTSRGPVIFTDTLDEEKDPNGALFRYLGYYPDIGQHLIGVVYYEGNDYVLVSNPTANAVYTGDNPHVSPSQKRIVVADAHVAYAPNLIQIWTLEGGRLRLEHSEPSKADSAHFVRWEDDTSFTVEEFQWDDDGMSASVCQDEAKPDMWCLYTYRWEGGVLTRSLAREPNTSCKANI